MQVEVAHSSPWRLLAEPWDGARWLPLVLVCDDTGERWRLRWNVGTGRMSETKVMRAFRAAHPSIAGSLCDYLAGYAADVLSKAPRTRADGLPADVAVLAHLIAAMPSRGFVAPLTDALRAVHAAGLDVDRVLVGTGRERTTRTA